MNVCIDVGNTTISMGFYEGKKLIKKVTQFTDANRTEDEYEMLLNTSFQSFGFSYKQVERVIFSSVVPSINHPFKSALKRLTNAEIMTIAPGIKTGIGLKVDDPNEIGNDLIADLVGAKEKYGYPSLIVDLGTASKILLLDKNAYFSSCLILPGLSLSAKSLTDKAALLPDVSLETPKTIMAKNTMDAMNAGIVFGHADMISGLVARYEKEIGYPVKHILTGGNSVYLKDILGDSFIYDANLTLDGLSLLLEKNEVKL